MKVRKGTKEDIDALSLLYDELIDVLNQDINYPGWKKGIYPTREDALLGIEEECLFVVEDQHHIIGTFMLRHTGEKGYHGVDWHVQLDNQQVLVIYTFAVHPAFLHQGVGESMLGWIIEYAKQNKIKALRLDVYQKNLPAIHLYEKMGFEYITTVDLGYGEYGLDNFRLYQYL